MKIIVLLCLIYLISTTPLNCNTGIKALSIEEDEECTSAYNICVLNCAPLETKSCQTEQHFSLAFNQTFLALEQTQKATACIVKPTQKLNEKAQSLKIFKKIVKKNYPKWFKSWKKNWEIHDLFTNLQSKVATKFIGEKLTFAYFFFLRGFKVMCQENPSWRSNFAKNFQKMIDSDIKSIIASVTGGNSLNQGYLTFFQGFQTSVNIIKKNKKSKKFKKYIKTLNTFRDAYSKAYLSKKLDSEYCDCLTFLNSPVQDEKYKALLTQRMATLKLFCKDTCNMKQIDMTKAGKKAHGNKKKKAHGHKKKKSST